MIAQNAGHEGAVVVEKVANNNTNYGFNAQTEAFGDLVEDGVIDPTKVVRTACRTLPPSPRCSSQPRRW